MKKVGIVREQSEEKVVTDDRPVAPETQDQEERVVVEDPVKPDDATDSDDDYPMPA